VIEVKNHRRVPRRHGGDYASAVISEIKNRLGVPKETEANKLAVRRMAHNIMTRHGVRPTHIRMFIEVVVAGVFVPDIQDQRAAEILASRRLSELRAKMREAGPHSVWERMWGRFTGSRGLTRAHH